MKREQAMELAKTGIEELGKALAAGCSDTLLKYLDTMSRFHSYSWGNIVLIALQKPDAMHVAGFTTWKKLGRNVKKGEQGIGIFAPMMYRKKADERTADVGEDDERAQALRGFKVVHVFDVSQTEGKELPEFAAVTGSPGEHLAKLRNVVMERGITLEYDVIPGGAEGVSQDGSIVIRPDLSEAEEFSVLVHELAHELLHKGERRKETTKTIRETEAEAVAYVVAKTIGLDCSTRSSDYIQLYRGDTETLSESLDSIQRTAAEIITALKPAA